MNVIKGIGWTVVIVVVIAAVVLGGWLAGWWFKEQNVEKESDVFRDSFANQERLREDSLDNISTIQSLEIKVAELPAGSDLRQQLEAQQVAIANVTCNNVSQINDKEETLVQFELTYC